MSFFLPFLIDATLSFHWKFDTVPQNSKILAHKRFCQSLNHYRVEKFFKMMLSAFIDYVGSFLERDVKNKISYFHLFDNIMDLVFSYFSLSHLKVDSDEQGE